MSLPRRRIPQVRLSTLTGGDIDAYRISLIALLLAVVASLGSGLTLASMTDTLADLPGLLLLVPAAIAVKGNIFGALGSRLGTVIHTGSQLGRRVDSVVGQNAVASLALSAAMAVCLALMAKATAFIFGISPTMSIVDYVVVSTVGGMLASVVVLVITLLLAFASARFGLDLDNVVAPLVSAAGDMVSLPAIVIAARFASVDLLTPLLAAAVFVGAVLGVIAVLRSGLELARSIVLESVPILIVAGILDLVAGVTVEKRLENFIEFPVLLILLPGFLGTAGSLGGILSSRLSTKLHLGLLRPAAIPEEAAVGDIVMTFALCLPVFATCGLISELGGRLTGQASPGAWDLVAVALLGGVIATAFVVAIAYYGTLVAVRFGVDPDTYGIPLVSSSLDFVGAFTLILAVVVVGVA